MSTTPRDSQGTSRVFPDFISCAHRRRFDSCLHGCTSRSELRRRALAVRTLNSLDPSVRHYRVRSQAGSRDVSESNDCGSSKCSALAGPRHFDRKHRHVTGARTHTDPPHSLWIGLRISCGVPLSSTTANVNQTRRPSVEVSQTLAARKQACSRRWTSLRTYSGDVDQWILGSMGSAPYEDPVARDYGRRPRHLHCRPYAETACETATLTGSGDDLRFPGTTSIYFWTKWRGDVATQ